MNAKTIVVERAIEMIAASSNFNDIVSSTWPKKLKIPRASTRRRFSHGGIQNPLVISSNRNVKTHAKSPKLHMTTEWWRSRRTRIRIIALAVKTALAIAAKGPQMWFDPSLSLGTSPAPKIDGGFTIKTIPNNVMMIVKMLKSPQGSPRKIREKIATKTGVEKIMTELKLREKLLRNCRKQISICHLSPSCIFWKA